MKPFGSYARMRLHTVYKISKELAESGTYPSMNAVCAAMGISGLCSIENNVRKAVAKSFGYGIRSNGSRTTAGTTQLNAAEQKLLERLKLELDQSSLDGFSFINGV